MCKQLPHLCRFLAALIPYQRPAAYILLPLTASRTSTFLEKCWRAFNLPMFTACLQFVQVIAPANEQQPQLVLTGLPHLTMDPQQSRGGTTTFTERWGDFLAGSSPPPAPAPAQHTSYCRTGVQAAMLGSSGQLGTAGSSHAGHGQSGNSEQHCRNSFSPLLQPLLQQQTQGRAGCSASSSGNGSRHLDHAAPGIMGISTADGLQGLSRQVNSQFFPLLLGQHAAVGHRPGSPELLPTGKVSRLGRAFCCTSAGGVLLQATVMALQTDRESMHTLAVLSWAATLPCMGCPICRACGQDCLLVNLVARSASLCPARLSEQVSQFYCLATSILSCCCAGPSTPVVCTKSSTSCVVPSTHAPSYSQSWQDEEQRSWRQQQQWRRRPSQPTLHGYSYKARYSQSAAANLTFVLILSCSMDGRAACSLADLLHLCDCCCVWTVL